MGNEGSKERSDDETAHLSDGGFKKTPREIIDSVERQREAKEQKEKQRLSSRRRKIASKLSITHGKAITHDRKFSPRSQEELSIATSGHELHLAEVSEVEDPARDVIRRESSSKSRGKATTMSPRAVAQECSSPRSPRGSPVSDASWPNDDTDSEDSTSEEVPGGRWKLEASSGGSASSLDTSRGGASSTEQEVPCDSEPTSESRVSHTNPAVASSNSESSAVKQRERTRKKARLMLQSSFDVQQYYSQLGFDQVEVGQLHDVFAASAGDKEVLDFASFNEALGRMEALGVQQMKDTPFAERLFEVFDSNKDHWIDKKEFLSGLGLLCKGTDEQKLSLTFSLYDVNDDGGISKEEIIEIFATTYEAKLRALAACNQPGVFKKMVDEEKLGMFVLQFRGVLASFVDGAFSKLDVDGNGLLDFEEFKAFAISNPHVSAELNGLKRSVKMSLV